MINHKSAKSSSITGDNKFMNISPTLNSKLLLTNRIIKGLPVYNGGLGENPLETPEYLIKCIQNNITKKEYTSIEGTNVFRKAISQYYPNHMKNTLVGNGLKELIFVLSFSWKKKIFIPMPCWVTYLENMKKLKKDYTTIECNHNNNYKLTAELLEDSLEKNNGHNSLLFLNSPTNPTGAVYTEEEYISLIKVFDKYNITVFSDEIYFNTSQIKTISLSNLYNNCILGSSLSKDWASGGWRFGWMVFPDSLKDLHADMVSCGSIMYSCPTDFFNNVGAEALINSENEQYFNKQRIFFQKISDNIDNELLKPNKLIISNYQGAWYKWVDLKNYSNELKLLNHSDVINNSEELANVLANEIGLIVVAGKFFGIEGATFRLSMVDENIHIGIRELIRWLDV